jgi:uncharacterized protein YraI
LLAVGWLLAVVVGVWLVWYGFTWIGENGQSEDASSVVGSPTSTQMAVWPTATPLPPSPTPSPAPPTALPLPTVVLEPTAVPATATSVVAAIVAGEQGVNVRTGPGTSYTRLGYLEPGTRADLIGRYGDWWQIRYDGAPAWVFGDLVTASNADNVPQVQPPTAPTAAPVTVVPTGVPPTATSAPAADFRGLVPDKFEVEGAPGPYAAAREIWFNMWILNASANTVEYKAVGIFVEETGQFQKSYTDSNFQPGQGFNPHRDHINQFTLEPGTYHLWMRICFLDGQCFKMLGPVTVTIQ